MPDLALGGKHTVGLAAYIFFKTNKRKKIIKVSVSENLRILKQNEEQFCEKWVS